MDGWIDGWMDGWIVGLQMEPTMSMMRNAFSTGATAPVSAAMMSRSEPSRPKSRMTRKARRDLQNTYYMILYV